MVDMQVIVRRQYRQLCASITCMIRHYVARRAKVIFDHPQCPSTRCTTFGSAPAASHTGAAV